MKWTKEESKHIETVKKYLKKGDLITHTRCMNILEEHIFTGYDGHWLCGKPTKMTKKYSEFSERYTDDISPLHVSHINRQFVDYLEEIEELNKGD